MYEGLKNLEAVLSEAKKKIADEGKNELGKAFVELFDKHPTLKAVKWTQYTPYFNDGSPCEFGINEWSAKIDERKSKYDDDDEDGDSSFVGEYEMEGGESLKDDIAALFRVASEEAFESSFGDHVKVVATREGFDVEEYSHD
jgi:hypothetical protein